MRKWIDQSTFDELLLANAEDNVERAIQSASAVLETVQDFIDSLSPEVERIMAGKSWRKPFASKQELAAWCKDNQPYYKKRIPGVNNYFARLYNLK